MGAHREGTLFMLVGWWLHNKLQMRSLIKLVFPLFCRWKWCELATCSVCPSPWPSAPCWRRHRGSFTASSWVTVTSWYDECTRVTLCNHVPPSAKAVVSNALCFSFSPVFMTPRYQTCLESSPVWSGSSSSGNLDPPINSHPPTSL